MNVYVFQADLLCKKCGQATREHLDAAGERPNDVDYESSYDSDNYPKGPYPSSESDSPEHCSSCGVFLQNPLTDDGMAYVRDALIEGPCSPTLVTWNDFYGINA